MTPVERSSGSLAEQVAEDLWQKGYDVQRSDEGWVVQEPLRGKSVTLASDADMLAFAAGRTGRPLPAAALTASSTTSPTPAATVARSHVHAAVASDGAPTLPSGDGPTATVALRPEHRTYIVAGVIVVSLLLNIWMVAAGRKSTHDTAESKIAADMASAQPAPAPEIPFRVVEARRDTPAQGSVQALPLPDNGRESPAAPAAHAVTAGKSMSDATDRCLAELGERLGLRNLALFLRGRMSATETCYAIHGREHCPYIGNGRAILNFIDADGGLRQTYACDVDIATGAASNFRIVQTNPDIVRFLIKGTDVDR